MAMTTTTNSAAISPPTGRIVPGSWLDMLTAGAPLRDDLRGELPQTVQFRGVQAVPLMLDHGNAQFKFALPNTSAQRRTHGPRLVTGAVSTATQPAEQVRGGQGIRTWYVGDGEHWSAPFWFGDDVLSEDDSLTIGETAERLGSDHHRNVVYAMLVHALIQAGHQPGAHHLLLGFGVPVEEVQAEGTIAATKDALRDAFRKRTVQVRLDDPGLGRQVWTLHLVSHAALPQSLGAFTAWSHTLWGTMLDHRVRQVAVIDIGGGHTQRMHVTVKGQGSTQPQVVGNLYGAGTVRMAETLRQKLRQHPRYNDLDLSMGAYQRILRDRWVLRGGRREDIGAIVDDTLNSEGARLLDRTADDWKERSQFVICTGGGSVLLREQLQTLAAKYDRDPESYLLMPDEVAATANAVGGFVQLMAIARRG
jgi:hypothetical protein